MSLLAPLFLVGALTVALPIVFHLIRRTTRQRTVFSSLMFLLPSPPRLTQRSRLEHLLLLLLRCAAIICLAVGFARPFLKQAVTPPDSSTAHRVLLLVDSSASMRRANLWADAQGRVESILRKVSPQDQVALYLYDQQIKPVLGFEQWSAAPAAERTALLKGKLAELSPGCGSTHLGNALIQAAEILGEAGGKAQPLPGRVEVITDLQEGSHLETLQGYDWPKGLEVSVEVLKPRGVSNAALQLVSDVEQTGANAERAVRVRVSNLSGSKREQFKVGWALAGNKGFAAKPIELYVPAGQSRVVPVPASSTDSLDRILLEGDDQDFDNLVFAVPPATLHLNVTYVGAESETDTSQPLYFLKRAFRETPQQAVQVTAHRPGDVLPAAEAQSSWLLIVTAALPPETSDALRELAKSGKTILCVLDTAAMGATLERLLQIDRPKLEEVRPSSYAMLGELDFRHPIFAPFADPRFSDFTKIHFWEYVRVDQAAIPHARTVAKFDSGDPALIEVPTGSGRVLILASGWQPRLSQLALSSKFVPLLYSILETSGVPAPLPAQYRVGDNVPLSALVSHPQSPITVLAPEDRKLTVDSATTNFTETDVPGVYNVTTEEGVRRFVVNLDPAESRTAPLSADELERFGVPLLQPGTGRRDPEAERKTRLQNADLESRQKLWRWFVAGTLAVLLFETWLAGRTARRAMAPMKPSPG